MILPCETAVKSVIPAIKALIAKELIEEHGFKQDHVAELLGISQSAVSKYTRKVRGQAVKIDKIEEIQPQIDNMITMLMERSRERKEFLGLFCQTCLMVRKKGIMCQFCQKSEPTIKSEGCAFCLSLNHI
ncbi:helix-turn-helix domain-containing protein [Candidatus Bathyarchaeota archaeon]|nr:helix-turn-helix domain-containing protein [Candidatus Bathyarchaeota archaeon]